MQQQQSGLSIKKSSLGWLAMASALLFDQVQADCYMQHPRGSNNKLNEQQNSVRNNRRLFDSQNNDNSGYQVFSSAVSSVSHLKCI